MNRPVHFEILCNDPGRLAAFYEEVFGWKCNAWQGQAYWLVTTGAEGDAGINGGLMGRYLPQPVINTVAVESLEATLAKVEAGGGKKVLGPNEIPGIGLHAYCADPEGTLFGLLQPASMDGKGG